MRLAVLVAAPVLLLVAGCGGSGNSAVAGPGQVASPSAPAPSPVELENPKSAAAAVAVTRRFVDALVNREPKVLCSLESPDFARKQVARAVELKIIEPGDTCIDLVRKMISNAEKADAEASTRYVVTATEAGDRQAKVRIDYPNSATAKPDAYQLIKRNGSWLIDKPLPAPTP